MKIKEYTQVDKHVTDEIRDLERKIKEADGVESDMYLADNLNFDNSLPWVFTVQDNEELIAAVVAFIPTKKEIELMGVTHPGYRRKGLFSALEEKVYHAWEKHNIPDVLYVLNENSESGKAVAASRGAVYQNTEYQMTFQNNGLYDESNMLEIVRAGENQLDTLAGIQERAFGLDREDARTFIRLALQKPNHHMFIGYLNNAPVGMGAIAVDEEAASIYGVCVLPEHQGFGYGKALMVFLIKEANRLVCKKITLEVDSSNNRAYELYRKLGFEAAIATGYYRKAIEK